jgi:hypothetical protein
MIVEAQATPRLAQKVVDKVRTVTDKPISNWVGILTGPRNWSLQISAQ